MKKKKKIKTTKMRRFFCKVTGGHVYDLKELKFNHIIDGVYEAKAYCKKCGAPFTDAVFMPGKGWIDNYNDMIKRWNNGNE